MGRKARERRSVWRFHSRNAVPAVIYFSIYFLYLLCKVHQNEGICLQFRKISRGSQPRTPRSGSGRPPSRTHPPVRPSAVRWGCAPVVPFPLQKYPIYTPGVSTFKLYSDCLGSVVAFPVGEAIRQQS
jgi:hypothetical protein